MITILTTSQYPKKKPWVWLLIRWCTWGVSKENYGLIKSGFWDTCKLDFAEFHLPYLTLLLLTECMLFWLFFFSHCRTNVTQSSQSTAEILKIEMCKYSGSNFLGLFRPLPMKEIELWSNTIWDSGPRLEIILEFWPTDWSTFGLGLEPFSSTVEGFCIWNLWSS